MIFILEQGRCPVGRGRASRQIRYRLLSVWDAAETRWHLGPVRYGATHRLATKTTFCDLALWFVLLLTALPPARTLGRRLRQVPLHCADRNGDKGGNTRLVFFSIGATPIPALG